MRRVGWNGGMVFARSLNTPDGALQELYGFLLVHHAIRHLIHQAAVDIGDDPDRISFTRSLRLVRRQVTDQAAFLPARLARAVQRSLTELTQRLLPARPQLDGESSRTAAAQSEAAALTTYSNVSSVYGPRLISRTTTSRGSLGTAQRRR